MSFGETCRIDLVTAHLSYLESGAAARSVPTSSTRKTESTGVGPLSLIAAVRGVIRENLCAIRDRQAGFMLFLSGHSYMDIIQRGGAIGSQGAFHVNSLPFTLVMTSPDAKPAFSADCLLTRCSKSVRRAKLFQKRSDATLSLRETDANRTPRDFAVGDELI